MRKAKIIMMSAGLLAMSLFSGLSFHSQSVMASDLLKCEMNSVEGKRGDTVEVTIKVTSNPGTIMSETRFFYDSNVVEVTNVTEHGMFETEETEGIVSDYVKPNFARNPLQLINGYQAFEGNTTNTGALYTIELKIKEDAAFGESEVNFTGDFLDWEFNEYEVDCNTATINVICSHEDCKEVEDKAPTCTDKGTNKKVCNICGETVGTIDVSAKGHSWSEWITDKAASCTEAGTEKRTCSECGNSESRDVAALGHKVDEWTITKEPTYTEEGSREGKCTVCSETITEVIKKIPATEIVSADDIFAKYEIADDTIVMDKDGNKLDENKLQLKGIEVSDNTSIKTIIGEFAKDGMELKELTAYQIKLITNTEGIEVAKLDKAMTVTMKVPTDYTAKGQIFVLGTDGVWIKSDIEIIEGTITFEMTEGQTYAFANFGEIDKSGDVDAGNNDTEEDNKSNSTENSQNSDKKEETTSNKTTNSSKETVKTGDATAVVSIVLLMVIAGIAVAAAKKKQISKE